MRLKDIRRELVALNVAGWIVAATFHASGDVFYVSPTPAVNADYSKARPGALSGVPTQVLNAIRAGVLVNEVVLADGTYDIESTASTSFLTMNTTSGGTMRERIASSWLEWHSASRDPDKCVIRSRCPNMRFMYADTYPLRIEGITFRDFTSGQQGAVFYLNGKTIAHTAKFTIENCHFLNNVARTGNGGAISGPVRLNNCYFEGNGAPEGEGGAVSVTHGNWGAFQSYVSNCLFRANFAGWKHKGVGDLALSSWYNEWALVTANINHPTVANCTYEGSYSKCAGAAEGPYLLDYSVRPGDNLAVLLEEIRRKRNPDGSRVTVTFEDGVYSVTDGFALIGKDMNITWRARNPGKVLMVGGDVLHAADAVPLSADSPVRARLRAEVTDRVLRLPVPDELHGYFSSTLAVRGMGYALSGRFLEELPRGEDASDGYAEGSRFPVFTIDGEYMQPARWPNDGDFSTLPANLVVSNDENFTLIRQPSTGAPEWRLEDSNAWVWGLDSWSYRTEPKRLLGREADGSIKVGKTFDLLSGGSQYQIVNLLEELDAPGEWCWDGETAAIYFIPPAGYSANSTIAIGHSLPHVFWLRTDGNRIEGIHFAAKNGLPALCIEKCRDNEVVGCAFTAMDTIPVFLSGRNNRLSDSDFHGLTMAAVCLRGGWAATLDWGSNVVENCHIWDFDRFVRGGWSVGGVHINASACRLAHNLIHGSVEQGIYLNGTFNIVEYNRVYDCVRLHADAGALYSQTCERAYGNVIRYNDIANSPGYKEVIYYDDCAGGFQLYGNVLRNQSAVCDGLLSTGRDNITSNNVIFGGGYAFYLGNHATSGLFPKYIGSSAIDVWNDTKSFYNLENGPLGRLYPEWAAWGDDLPKYLAGYGSRWENNLFIKMSGDPINARGESGAGWDRLVSANNASCVVRGTDVEFIPWGGGGITYYHGTDASPLDCDFVDLPESRMFSGNRTDYDIGDFNQTSLEATRAMIPGWMPIPFDDIGLYVTRWRTTLPYAAKPASFLVGPIEKAQIASGMPAEPHPIVTLKSTGETLVEGVDYVVSWSANDAVETGRITVKGIGRFASEHEVVTKSFQVGEIAFYATQDGDEDSDCTSWATAGTISNAVSKLNALGEATYAIPHWVILKSGTVENPAIYDLSSLAGRGIEDYVVFRRNYTGIKTDDPDQDPRKTVIVGGGINKMMRFAKANNVFCYLRGVTVRDFAVSDGGAAFYDGNSKLIVSNCAFVGNASLGGNGGALYNPRAVYASTFRENMVTNASKGGGALCAASKVTPIVDCAFVNNRAFAIGQNVQGGASFCGAYSGCVFTGNKAKPLTDGYQNWGDAVAYGVLTECIVSNQTQTASFTQFTRCRFIGSEARSYGGAHNTFSSCYFTNSLIGSAFVATNCLIVGKDVGSATSGLLEGTLCNCTIVGNKSSLGNQYSAIIVRGSTLYNCLLFNPDCGYECGRGAGTDTSGVTAYNTIYTRGKGSPRYGADNISISSWGEAGFVGCGAEPYALAAGSPAIDAGTNIVSLLVAKDIVGNPRLVGPRMDIGCYEYVPPSARIEGEVDAQPGAGYAGSTVTVSVAGLVTGVYSRDAFHATFTVNGKTYAGVVTSADADGCRVTFTVDAAGEHAVVAEHAYVGVLELWLEDERNGRTELASRDVTLVQGTVVRETHPWFREIAPNLGTDGTWEQIDDTLRVYTPSNAMPEGAAATVETSFVFKGLSEENDGPLPDGPQGAIRFVSDGKDGNVLQVYAAVADKDGAMSVGWQSANVAESADYKFVEGVSYVVRLEFDYPTGAQDRAVPLVCLVKAADEQTFVKLFEGFAVTAQTGGACTANRVSRAGFLGEAPFDSLMGEYAVMRIKADVDPTVDGVAVAAERVFEAARTTRPIAYPSAPVVTGEVGAQKIVFGGVTVAVLRHYTATVSGNTVMLTLNDFARPVISDGDGDKKAISVGETTVSLHISNAIEGLFYRVVSASTLGDEWTPVTEFLPVADFTVDRKVTDTSAFYKIDVSDVQKEKE